MVALAFAPGDRVRAQEPGAAPVQERDRKRPRPDGDDSRAAPRLDVIGIAAAVAERFDAEEILLELDAESGRGVLVLWGNARGESTWNGETVRIQADRIAVLGERRRAPEGGGGGDGKGKDNAKDKDKDKAKAKAKGAGPGAGRRGPRAGLRMPSFYAEGNVRLETAEVVLETDAFFYTHETGRGVAVRARGRGRLGALSRLERALDARNFTFLGLDDRGDGGPTMGSPAAGKSVERRLELPPALPAGERRGRPEPAAPLRTWSRDARQLVFRADLLRVLDLDHYEGEGIVISTCEFGEPHFALVADAATVTRLRPERRGDGRGGKAEDEGEGEGEGEENEDGEEARGDGGEPDEPDDFEIDPEGAWLAVGGRRVLPLPLGAWNTAWNEYSPVRRVLLSNSSKLGTRAGVDWKLEWLLAKLPGGESEPAASFLDDATLDLRTEHAGKRGFGYGLLGEWGSDPEGWKPWDLDPTAAMYHGTTRAYRIYDHGKDRTGPADAFDFDEWRWWGNVVHRQRIPYAGVLDVEFSQWSDENFLTEFFPETRREKEQENVFYFRRQAGDTFAVTALAKYRTNAFESTTERLPEAKLFLLEQPVVRAGPIGAYTSITAQAARLRHRPADDIRIPRALDDPTDEIEARTRDYGRADVENEWSVPFGFGQYVRMRPFASVRLSAYETGLHPDDHSITRRLLGSGVTASQNWSRVYPVAAGGWVRRWFGFTAFKHDVIPKVTYASLFESNVDSARLFQVDEVDAADDLETIDLSVRNVLWARGRRPRVLPRFPPRVGERAGGARGDALATAAARRSARLRDLATTTHAVVDLETSLRWFLQPARDNGGDRFSELDLDLAFYPLRAVAVRSRNFLDPQRDFRFLLSDNSVTVDAIPRRLFFTVGERTRRGLSEFYYTRVGLRLGRRYSIDAFYGFDADDSKRTDAELRLIRYFHRFAVELSYSFDAGERGNQTVSVNVYPVELLREGWEKRVRRSFRY